VSRRADRLRGPTSVEDSATPVAVSDLAGATAIAAGALFTCALLPGGTVACWGFNDVGQLGNGTTTFSRTPVLVAGLTGATGERHACALLPDGTVTCWGFNSNGQLGNGTTTDSTMPVGVAGGADHDGRHRFRDVALFLLATIRRARRRAPRQIPDAVARSPCRAAASIAGRADGQARRLRIRSGVQSCVQAIPPCRSRFVPRRARNGAPNRKCVQRLVEEWTPEA
jgi:Regulator of chromosome condensation (RCC1) repeat